MKLLFKDTRPGGQLLGLLLIFVAFFIIGTGVSAIPMLFGGNPTSLVSQALSQIVVFGGAAVFFCVMFQENTSVYLRLAMPKRAARTFTGVLLVLLTILPLSDWLTTLNDSWHFPKSFAALEQLFRELSAASEELLEAFLLRDGVGSLMANMLVLALVPAICEELFFRGAFQQTLMACFRGKHHVAIWLTAAIFSLMHGDLFAFLPRFLLGLLLGYLYYYGQSLWVNVFAHFLNNTIVVILYFLAARGVVDVDMAESMGFPFVVVLVTAIVCMVLFWLFFVADEKKSKKK